MPYDEGLAEPVRESLKGFDSQKDLGAWVERCLSYVSTLPKK